MTEINTLIERNTDFAAHNFAEIKGLMPALKAMIITCVDARVDPANLFELEPGEALVIRCIGGRVTPTTFQQINLLQTVIQVAGLDPGEGFCLVVLHHTNCGITALAKKTDLLADYFQVGEEELAAKSVTNPHAAVAGDVELIKNNPTIPAEWFVCGMVYDVKTGLVKMVIPPAPVRQ